jgi:hypothetical protein
MSAVISLRYSDDGGENWSNWRELAAGETGQFLEPITARQLGITRHRIWEFRDTSGYATDILSASIKADSE